MIRLLQAIHARMIELQQRRRFQIVASLLAVAALSSWFIPATLASFRIEQLERSIVDVLAMADIEAGESAAIDFAERGLVTVDGVDYQDERLAGIAQEFFNEDGKIVGAANAATFLVAEEMPDWVPALMLEDPMFAVGLWGFTLAWTLAVIWCGMSWTLLLSLFGAGVLSSPFWMGTVVFGRLDSPPNIGAVLAILGMVFLGMTFALLTRGALFLLSRPRPVWAIAHGVVKEAVRLRISVAFIVVLVILLPLIPVWIDETAPLRYQLQTYLSRSISFTFVLLACMTLVLGVASVSFEIRDRQIWQVMTKPVSRLQYLLGKWIGLGVLNAVGMATASIAIFLAVEQMKTRPPQDAVDELAVRTEVLTARAGVMPVYDVLDSSQLRETVNTVIDDDAELRGQIERKEVSEIQTRARIAGELRNEFSMIQRRVAPGNARTLEFKGLSRTLKEGTDLRMRYLFHCGASDTHEVHPLLFVFPKTGEFIDVQYVATVGAFLRIPSSLVEDDGSLRIQLVNGAFDDATSSVIPATYTVNWDIDDLEVLYTVSSFEANFLRAMLVDWVKLSFLGVLAVVTGAFLSFPVACLLSFSIFIGGSIAPFLGMSLNQYSPTNVVEVVIAWIASMVHILLQRFGAVQPSQMLVEGRVVPWSEVGLEFFWLLIVWAGLALVIGFLAFRRKELAIYSGQG